jgi:hypothetical protein
MTSAKELLVVAEKNVAQAEIVRMKFSQMV